MERSTETTETTEKLGYQKIISALSAVPIFPILPIFPTLLINLVQSAPHLSLSKQKKNLSNKFFVRQVFVLYRKVCIFVLRAVQLYRKLKEKK